MLEETDLGGQRTRRFLPGPSVCHVFRGSEPEPLGALRRLSHSFRLLSLLLRGRGEAFWCESFLSFRISAVLCRFLPSAVLTACTTLEAQTRDDRAPQGAGLGSSRMAHSSSFAADSSNSSLRFRVRSRETKILVPVTT